MSKETSRIPELFGSCVFNEETMAQYVPKGTMDAWRSSLQNGKPLERMIPFVSQFVDGVDLPGRRITVDWQVDY